MFHLGSVHKFVSKGGILLLHDQNKEKARIDLDYTLNPYEDLTLHESLPEQPTLNNREPFNDIIEHGDIIAGYQQNRTLSDFPQHVRPMVKYFAIVSLLLFLGSLLWNVLH
jgi:hypothetical protein